MFDNAIAYIVSFYLAPTVLILFEQIKNILLKMHLINLYISFLFFFILIHVVIEWNILIHTKFLYFFNCSVTKIHGNGKMEAMSK